MKMEVQTTMVQQENPKSKKQDIFTDKWTEPVARKGYYQKPNCLTRCLKQLGLTQEEALVLDYILSWWNEPSDYSATVSIAEMSKGTSIAYSTIGHHIRSLENKGFIRRKFNKGRPSTYIVGLTVAKLRSHVASFHSPRRRGGVSSNMGEPPPSEIRTNNKGKFIENKSTQSLQDILDDNRYTKE